MSAVSEAAEAPGAPGPYRRLLGEPALRGLAVADVCARLPQGMVTITLLLMAATHAPMTTAGLVVAGYTLGQAVTGPLRGRLADRYGLARVCAACGCGYTVALLGLLAGSLTGAPGWLLVAAAAAAGLIVPPLSPGMRSLWSACAAGALRQTAFALDAAVFDFAYLTGPVVASALAAGVAPAAAVGVLLALIGAAIVIIARRSPPAGADAETGRLLTPRRKGGRWPIVHPLWRSMAHRARSAPGPLASPALRRLLVTGGLLNAALAATEVALTGYVRQHHALWAAGPLLAGVSAGSIVGSLLLGARGTGALGREASRRLPRLLSCYALGLAVLTAASLYAPLVALAAPLAGLCLGPSLATLFNLASSASSASSASGASGASGESAGAVSGGSTEAQGWLNSVMNGGAAAGAALAAAAARQPVLALALCAALAAAAAASSAWRHLHPAQMRGVKRRRRWAVRLTSCCALGRGRSRPGCSTTATGPRRSRCATPTRWQMCSSRLVSGPSGSSRAASVPRSGASSQAAS
ncbi:MAG TPA: MFS transporter [Trebonia sp.]|nr:MFS transporter [Trebonia sp.]